MWESLIFNSDSLVPDSTMNLVQNMIPQLSACLFTENPSTEWHRKIKDKIFHATFFHFWNIKPLLITTTYFNNFLLTTFRGSFSH